MSQHDQWDIVSGVGITALGVAFARGIESARADRLIEDPFAEAFVTAAEPLLPERVREFGWRGADGAPHPIIVDSSHVMAVRTRVLDDALLTATSAGIRQVVILAAGLDARAYRLAWPPALRLFEIDQPKVLEFKDTVLREAGASARCTRTTVAVDLREDWAGELIAAGFAADQPTAWLIEGLLAYLPPEAEQRLFESITTLSAPGSHVSAEYITDVSAMVADKEFGTIAKELGDELGFEFHTGPRPRPGVWLSAHGWTVTEESARAAAERYHRDLTPGPAAGRVSMRHSADFGAFLTARRTT